MSIYIDSSRTGGTNAGTSWANAYLKLKTAEDANTGGGTTFWIANTHSETNSSTVVYTFTNDDGGDLGMDRVLSVAVSGDPEPPTALLAGATIEFTGNGSDLQTKGNYYMYGVHFKMGAAVSSTDNDIFLNNQQEGYEIHEEVTFEFVTTGSSTTINLSTDTGDVHYIKCHLGFKHANNSIRAFRGRVTMTECDFLSGSTQLNYIFFLTDARLNIKGLDLSNIGGTTFDTAIPGNDANTELELDGVKYPTSWTGTHWSTGQYSTNFGAKISLYNWGSDDVNHSIAASDNLGETSSDDRLYFTGVDGALRNTAAVPFSVKIDMASQADDAKRYYPKNWITYYTESTAEQTATIEFIHDESADLKDSEIWLEVMYEGTSGQSLPIFATDGGNILVTADQTTSSGDWDDGLTERADSTAYSIGDVFKASGTAGSVFIVTSAGTSASSPPAGYTSATDGDVITDNSMTVHACRRQKLSVTFTAAEQGRVDCRVVVAKSSAVVWHSPKVVVT